MTTDKKIQHLLTDEEERQLGERIQQGDQHSLDRLVTANLGFVISVARQYQDKGLDLDDLVSEGNIALMMAASKWNPSKGGRFIQYAVWDIRRAITNAISQQNGVVRKPQSANGKMSQVSMDAPLRKGYTRTLGETMPAKGHRPQDAETDDASFGYGLLEGIHILNEREKEVVKYYYGLGVEQLTMAEIGEKMGLKRERVRQIRKKAERKLRKPLREYRS